MEFFKIPLPADKGMSPELHCYIPSNYEEIEIDRKRPAVIVCPGGAYRICSERESEAIALQYLAADMAAFILYYSAGLEKATFPRCTLEALSAIKTVRENSGQWNIDPQKIAILGFSAGGHLAASTGAFWNTDLAKEHFEDYQLCKPNAAVLCYPVITGGEFAHLGSMHSLFGYEVTQEQRDSVSIEKLVTESYPPTFLWHTATDKGVPVQNSLLMASALANHHIPFEMHVYPTGVHGLGLADERTAKHENGIPAPHLLEIRPRRWVKDSIAFLKDVAFQTK